MTKDNRRLGLFAVIAGLIGLVVWWATADDGGAADATAGDKASVVASPGGLGKADIVSPPSGAVALDVGGTISGRVMSSDGEPVAGADVCAATRSDEIATADRRLPKCTKSSSDGAYQLTGLFRVRHGVSASARGFQPVTFGDGEADFVGVRLDRQQDEMDVDFTLEPGGAEIRGIVRDLSGGVIEGAFVHAPPDGRSWSGGTGAIGRTDAEGEFVLWGSEGENRVTAWFEGYTAGDDGGLAPGHRFTIVLTPESILAGTVRDADGKPVAGAQVSGKGGWFTNGGMAISDDRGHYRITGLGAGRYKPEAEMPGAQGFAKESVRLGVGQSVDGVDVFLYPVAQVKVSVTDDTGGPCELGRVTLQGRKNKERPTAEIDDGVAEFKGVRPGSYKVSVRCHGFASKDEYADLEVADENLEIAYTVETAKALRGVVVDSQGEPPKDASVIATLVGGKRVGGVEQWAQADRETGSFELLGLRPGSYTVKVWASDYPNNADPIEAEVPETGEAEELRIELVAIGGVRGTVTDSNGDPVKAATVRAKGAGWQSAQVKDDGTYELTGLAAGDYRITVSGKRWSDQLRKPGSTDDDVQGEKVTVVVNEMQELDLVVESQEGTIEGTVVDEDGGPLVDAYVSVSRQSDSAAAGGGAAKRQSRWAWGREPILTDVEGKFIATDLADGTYTLRAYRKGGGEGFVEDVEVGATDALIQLQVEGSIGGTVKTDAGATPERFSVTVADPKAGFYRSEKFVRTDGAWVMRELPAGTFNVSASCPEGTAEHKDIALAPAQDIEAVALTLEGRTTIRGRVLTLDTNEPVVGVIVRASKRGGGSTSFMMGEKAGKEMTDDEGRYELQDAPTGKIMLRTAPASFADFGSANRGSLSVVAESGTVLEAPDMFVPPKRVKQGEARGDLGFKIKQKDLGDEDDNPPKVVGVIRPGGPAADSGLAVGDVITKVDGHAVDGAQPSLYPALTEVPPGAKVQLTVERGETITIVAGDPV